MGVCCVCVFVQCAKSIATSRFDSERFKIYSQMRGILNTRLLCVEGVGEVTERTGGKQKDVQEIPEYED